MESDDRPIILDNRFIVDLVFKPLAPGLKIRPEETQLLLTYIGEILKEIEAEEQNAAKNVAEKRD